MWRIYISSDGMNAKPVVPPHRGPPPPNGRNQTKRLDESKLKEVSDAWRHQTAQLGIARHPWTVESSPRLFLALFKDKFGGSYDTFYNVTQRDLVLAGGKGLLALYGHSPSRLFRQVFPDHQWLPWRFSSTPRGFWNSLATGAKSNDEESLRLVGLLVRDWEESLDLAHSPEAWRDLLHNTSFLKSNRTSISHFGSLNSVLKFAYPGHNWPISTSNGAIGLTSLPSRRTNHPLCEQNYNHIEWVKQQNPSHQIIGQAPKIDGLLWLASLTLLTNLTPT